MGVYEEDDLEAHARAVEGAPAGTPQAGIPRLRDGDDTDTDSGGDSAPLGPPTAGQSAPITSEQPPTTEGDIIIKRSRRQRDLGECVYRL